MAHLKLYQPRKILYVDAEYYESFQEVAFVSFYDNDKFIVTIEDNEPTKFFMTRYKFNKYFRKVLLEKFGEI